MGGEKQVVAYGGTFLNKGGAAIAYGTLSAFKDVGIGCSHIIDPEPFPDSFYTFFNLKPIFRYSDLLCSRTIRSALSPQNLVPLVKCLRESGKKEISELDGMNIWHVGDSPFSDERSVASLMGQAVALESLRRSMNGDVIVGGVSLGHPRTLIGYAVLKTLFRESVSFTFARGEQTYNLLQKLGVPENRIRILPDFAFQLEHRETRRTRRVCSELSDASGPRVALIFREFSRGSERYRYIETIKRLIKRLRGQGYQPYMVPTSYSYLQPENDFQFLAGNSFSDEQTVDLSELEPDEVISVFKCFDVVISSRLHGAVFGTLANVPTIHLWNGTKSLEVIQEVFGRLVPMVRLRDFASGDGLDRVLELIEIGLRNRDRIATSMEDSVNDARRKTISALRQFLEETELKGGHTN